MRSIMTILSLLFISLTAFSANLRKADQIVQILNTDQVRDLVDQNRKSFAGIKFLRHGRGQYPPSYYQLTFVGENANRECVEVKFDYQINRVVDVSSVRCM